MGGTWLMLRGREKLQLANKLSNKSANIKSFIYLFSFRRIYRPGRWDMFDMLLWKYWKTEKYWETYCHTSGEQGVAMVRADSPPTNVARVRVLASTLHVGWVCCWCSPLLRVLWFAPLLKNQPTRNQVDEEPLSGCATSKSLFIYFTFSDKKEIVKKEK